jgi:F-type H+-transporting ATPase subunit epsilon
MKLELITLTGPKLEEEVYEVTLPTSTGVIAVLPGHMPLVTTAVAGVISVRRHQNDNDDQLEHFATNGGVIEVTGAKVRLLMDEADQADEIVEAEARQALERAKAAKENAKDKIELEKAQAVIARQSVRLKVAGLRRHRRRS